MSTSKSVNISAKQDNRHDLALTLVAMVDLISSAYLSILANYISDNVKTNE